MFLHNLEKEEFLDLYDASRVQIEQDKDSWARNRAKKQSEMERERLSAPLVN